MDPRELAEAFQAAFEAGDFDTVASYLADDFQFSGATPEPIGAQEWLGMSMALRAGIPDISYNFVIEGVEGDVVTSSAQITGTHTDDLDLSGLGMGVIPATGAAINNPRETNDAVVSGDKLKSVHVNASPEGGVPGILLQIGVDLP